MVTDVLRPSGYAEGASVALGGFSGREVTGLLHMSFADSGVVDRVREVVAASSAACSRVVGGDQVALDRVHLSHGRFKYCNWWPGARAMSRSPRSCSSAVAPSPPISRTSSSRPEPIRGFRQRCAPRSGGV